MPIYEIYMSCHRLGEAGCLRDKVYRNGAQVGTTASTSYQDNGLAPNTTYTFTVAAYDPAGNTSAQSTAVSVTTQGDNTPPSVPMNLTATIISPTQVNLTWTASTDPDSAVAGYNVYRNGSKIAATAVTSYQDTALIPDSTYTYTVSAYDAAGNTSAQSSPVSVTPMDPPPSVPTKLTATAVSSTQVNLSWSPSTDNLGVAGYKIYRGTIPGILSQIATWPTTSYSDGALAAFTTYYYAVAAYDAAGTTAGQSAQVSVKTLDTIPPVVVITSPLPGTVVTGNHLTITATATDPIAGIASVQFLIDGLSVGTVFSAPYTISYNTSSLRNGSHTITAIAKDKAGNSATSQPVTFLIQGGIGGGH
jgi:chitodextrinase